MQSRSTRATAGTMTTKHAVSFYILHDHTRAKAIATLAVLRSESVPMTKHTVSFYILHDHTRAKAIATLRVLRPECVPWCKNDPRRNVQRLECVQRRKLRVCAFLFDKVERLTMQATKEPHKPNVQAMERFTLFHKRRVTVYMCKAHDHNGGTK